MQWLRHTRADPPSINEQQLDEIRQAHMKQLAAQADARWASKPSALDPPSRQQPQPGAFVRAPAAAATQIESGLNPGVNDIAATQKGTLQSKENAAPVDKGRSIPTPTVTKESPWKDLNSDKGEKQPESWAPRPVRRG